MTHSRRKDSLSRYRSECRDKVGGRPHGDRMSGAWPECSRRGGGSKQGVSERGGGAKQGVSERGGGATQGVSERGGGATQGVSERGGKDRDHGADPDRKSYPLRRRAALLEFDTRNCHVVLTRLEQEHLLRERSRAAAGKHPSGRGKRRRQGQGGQEKDHCSKKRGKDPSLPPKTQLEPALEPRKRRMASLNAEAVNSLLLERDDGQQAHKVRRLNKDPHEPSADLPASCPGPCGSGTAKGPQSLESGPKWRGRKVKVKEEPKEVDWGAPAPKRLAGLNAAALLKLTSASAGARRRLKLDSKGGGGGGGGGGDKQGQKSEQHKHHHHHHHHHHHQHQHQHQLQVLQQGTCLGYKKDAGTLKTKWETGRGGFPVPGYQCRSLLGYPLKSVKEEPRESQLDPFYCGHQDKVEYCHRLALFLGHHSQGLASQYGGPGEASPPPSPLKQEFLIPHHSLAHSALAVGSHTYLCAEPCFSGYYLHIGHQGASSPPLLSGTGPFHPSAVRSSKLLVSTATPGPPSGIPLPHPVFCSALESPCFGEACRVNGFSATAYRAMQPLTSRGCAFNSCRGGCMHALKEEPYPSPLDEHSPAIPVSPALPLSGCPVPTVPPAAQSVPRLPSPLLDPSQTQLKVARECPQSGKPPSGSRSGVRSTASCPLLTPAPPPAAAAGKQQRITRRRATNGWLPVGVPVEKEVYIVGEEEPAVRRCFEGVQRDGDLIRVRDTVLLRSGPRKKTLPYVAKISALWEDPKTGEVMMSLFWYYRPEHTQGGRNLSTQCENEIFASRHQDENSVACIEDKCYVLTLAQYCRFCALVKRRGEGLPDSAPVVPPSPDYATPPHRRVPPNIDPSLVFLCRHVYDFRYGRILKNLQ
ncbi:Bromo adjacent homology domain-containing 1 protein [Acipenser ruthenus]|uniref:Bromo adjacent homology domain-containing 1 protein n=1 Tax=Acipenser ruthenus TaxID=7906 RepID=A0A444V0D8_ACIRT|nr:Bromo adjacent homology domain-containing 1 protein [Acipenser ruthenus]